MAFNITNPLRIYDYNFAARKNGCRFVKGGKKGRRTENCEKEKKRDEPGNAARKSSIHIVYIDYDN